MCPHIIGRSIIVFNRTVSAFTIRSSSTIHFGLITIRDDFIVPSRQWNGKLSLEQIMLPTILLVTLFGSIRGHHCLAIAIYYGHDIFSVFYMLNFNCYAGGGSNGVQMFNNFVREYIYCRAPQYRIRLPASLTRPA